MNIEHLITFRNLSMFCEELQKTPRHAQHQIDECRLFSVKTLQKKESRKPHQNLFLFLVYLIFSNFNQKLFLKKHICLTCHEIWVILLLAS